RSATACELEFSGRGSPGWGSASLRPASGATPGPRRCEGLCAPRDCVINRCLGLLEVGAGARTMELDRVELAGGPTSFEDGARKRGRPQAGPSGVVVVPTPREAKKSPLGECFEALRVDPRAVGELPNNLLGALVVYPHLGEDRVEHELRLVVNRPVVPIFMHH